MVGATARRTDGRFWAAFALSLSMHVLLLTAAAYGVSGARPAAAPQPGLRVELVGGGRDTAAASGDQDRALLALRTPPRTRIAAQSLTAQAQRAEPQASLSPSRAVN